MLKNQNSITLQARESWDYLDSKIIEAKIINTKKSRQSELEVFHTEIKEKLLNKNNYKTIKNKKQRDKSWKYAAIERKHNPNTGEFGLYRLKDTKTHISAYQQYFIIHYGLRIRTTDNKTKWLLLNFVIAKDSKVEFLGALEGKNIPYFKYRIYDKNGNYLERYFGDIDIVHRGEYSDFTKGSIKNTRNEWRKWFKAKELPFAPNYASNEVIALPQYNNILELLLIGTPRDTGIESLELLQPNEKVIAFCVSFDTFKRALEVGYKFKTKFLLSNARTNLHLTWKDGKLHKEKYPKRGYTLIVCINPKDIDEEVFYTDSKGKKKSFYSQNIGKLGFNVNEVMPALFAVLWSMEAKAISYNAPLCDKGYTMYGNEVQDFDTIVKNIGVKRNIEKTCKDYANSTYKQMKPAIMGNGGNFTPALKITSYYASYYRDSIMSIPESKRFGFVLNITRIIGKKLDELSPKPFRLYDDAFIKIAKRICRQLIREPETLHKVGVSLGSLIRNASRHALDIKNRIAQFIRNLMGYTTDGTKEILVFTSKKIIDYSKFLGSCIADLYFAIYDAYENIGIKEVKVGWQKRYSIVYGDS